VSPTAEVCETPFGKFLVYPQDLIGRTTKAGTLWDGHCLAPVALEHARLGEPGMTVLDIGANIGTFSVWLARHGAWRVVAVEPNPDAFRLLWANLDLNKDCCLAHVVPLEVAAWNEYASLSIVNPCPPEEDGNIGGHAVVLDTMGPIRGVPLDSYQWLFGQRVSLIKIDVEGAEGPVLAGLEQTLHRDRPVLLVETTAIQQDRCPLRTVAIRHGYRWHQWPTLPNNYLLFPQD